MDFSQSQSIRVSYPIQPLALSGNFLSSAVTSKQDADSTPSAALPDQFILPPQSLPQPVKKREYRIIYPLGEGVCSSKQEEYCLLIAPKRAIHELAKFTNSGYQNRDNCREKAQARAKHPRKIEDQPIATMTILCEHISVEGANAIITASNSKVKTGTQPVITQILAPNYFAS